MASEIASLAENYADLKAFTVSLLARLAEQTHRVEHQAAELKSQAIFIEKLKFELARLKRWRFGAQSERLDAEQLALWQTELEADIAAAEHKLAQAAVAVSTPAQSKGTPKRERLPDCLPRVELRHELASCNCAQCGTPMQQIGEDVAEQLDVIPAQFFVRRHIRPKYACRHCETVVAAAMPAQVIDKGLPAPGLLAHVIVSKYQDHCPLHRQEAIYARMGVELARSTMAGWLGGAELWLEALVERLHAQMIGEAYLQADETPVPVLAPGNGRTKTAYLWAYRSGPWSELQAVVFDFQTSRGGQHPKAFLQGFAGTLQVDGYAGYNTVFAEGKVIEARCVAHARRHFYEVYQATHSPIAAQGLAQIAKLYDIEREIKDLGADHRRQLRRARAGPLLEAFKAWLESIYAKCPPRGALAKAIAYSLNRWRALNRYVDDGVLNIDTNPVERCIRPIAVGRGNWLFCGSEGGGRRAALIYSLLGTAQLNGVNPYDYLLDVFTRIPTCKAKDLDLLLPHRWQPAAAQQQAA
jgi:transposase